MANTPTLANLIDNKHCLHVANRFRSEQQKSDDHPLLNADCLKARQSITQWPGYSKTPLLDLQGLAGTVGVNKIWYKDEAPRFGLGSFKALGGAYAVSVHLMKSLSAQLARAVTLEELTSGSLREETARMVVCCATDGNHGRSVAWGAQRFNCRCVIYIHSEVSEGRKAAIAAYGAEVIRIDGNYDDSVRLAASEADKNGWTVVSDTSYPGYLEIPADVMRGYTVLADEIYDELESLPAALPTHVFLQGGVGGFAAAITERVRARSDSADTRIIVAEPDKAECIYQSIKAGEPVAVHGELDTLMAGLACGEVSVIAFKTLLAEIDDVLVVSDDAAVSCMRFLADGVNGDVPLVAGESAVAGLAGLIIAMESSDLSEQLALDKTSRILIIGTEGATDPAVYRELVGRDAEEVTA